MAKLSIHEAKAQFSDLMRRVEGGETIVITRHSRPVVEMKPVESHRSERRLGAFEGWFEVPEDAFAPLTEENLKDWYGG